MNPGLFTLRTANGQMWPRSLNSETARVKI